MRFSIGFCLALWILPGLVQTNAGAQAIPPPGIYLDESAAPHPSNQERDRGFLLCSRSHLRVVFPNSVPSADERLDHVSISACPGEYEPAVIIVRALRELQQIRMTVSDLRSTSGEIPANQVDVRSIRFHPKQGQNRWGPYHETLMEVPLFLEHRNGLTVPADRNQPFWLTVHVPQEAKAGRYAGIIGVETAHGGRAEIPLTLDVHPFHLADPKGICFGFYMAMGSVPGKIADAFKDMRAHGMTSVGLLGGSRLQMSLSGNTVSINWDGHSALERNLDEYVRAGFPEPPTWLMGRDGADISRFCERSAGIESERFAELFRQIILQINDHGKQVGWPEIIYQPADEPFGHSDHLDKAQRLTQIIKSLPGVRTETDGMNARWGNFTRDWYKLIDVLTFNDGPTLHRGNLNPAEWQTFHDKAIADGKRIWFYNIDVTGWHPEPMRFMSGFGLWKSGCQGVLQWVYQWPRIPANDPGEAYKEQGPTFLLYRFPMAPGESGGPTVAYEAFREGIDDYRYLLTLRALVSGAERSSNAMVAKRAKELWRHVQARLDAAKFDGCKGQAMQGDWTGKCETRPDGVRVVRGDLKIANNWRFEGYDSLRHEIALAIIELQQTGVTAP